MANFDPIFIIFHFSKKDDKHVPNLLTRWADLGKVGQEGGVH
jgi:hypothetical protein